MTDIRPMTKADLFRIAGFAVTTTGECPLCKKAVSEDHPMRVGAEYCTACDINEIAYEPIVWGEP